MALSGRHVKARVHLSQAEGMERIARPCCAALLPVGRGANLSAASGNRVPKERQAYAPCQW